MASSQITSLLLKTYITAVRFYKDDFIISAAGGNLNIYHLNSEKAKVLCLQVFQGQSIHGIIFNSDDECVVYGGKLIGFIHLTIFNNKLTATIKHIYSINDWILKAQFVQNYLLAVTAHNNAVLICCKTGSEKNCFTSDEKCILYSAEIVVDENTEINNNLILGGTVFSEIIIWKTKYLNECNKILHRLQGHKGVIFSIAFSKKLQKITSTSDDRSLRIWDIKEKSVINDNEIFWENVDIVLLKTVYGHMDRVRTSVIAEKYNLIISIGEDSMICIWDLCGNLLNKKSSHQCGPIWALDVHIGKQLIVTGGGDGGVLLHKLVPSVPHLQSLPSNISEIIMNNTIRPKIVLYTQKSTLVCISHEGFLLKFVSECNSWNLLDHMPEMFSYCVADSKLAKLIVCGLNGCIRIYEEACNNFKLLFNKKLFKERIVSIVIAQNGKVILCTELGFIFVYVYMSNDLHIVNNFKVPLTNEPWFTAADIYEDYLIIGDRKGNIHLYSNELLPVNTISKVHCHLGVTRITINDDSIISTGRDGKCVNFKILSKKLVKVSSTKNDLKWIDRCIFVNNMQLLCGFMSNKFMICTSNEIIWQINCGGGHRSYDICIFNDVIYLAFIKNSVVCKISVAISDILLEPIENSFLNKEINCLKSIIFNEQYSIFVSGGEDTVLTVSIFDKNLNKISKYLTIQTHLSNIKDIKLIKCDGDSRKASFFIISCGGRAQICISKININFSNDIPILETEFIGEDILNNFNIAKKNKTAEELFQDMRYMSISVKPCDMNEKITESNMEILIFTGCSDGFFRLFKMKINNCILNINLFASGLNGKCILHLHTIQTRSPVGYYTIITMDTEGMLKFWNYSLEYNNIYTSENDIYKMQPISSWKLHENGINSYYLKTLMDDLFIIATGGDDNSLKLTLFKLYYNSHILNISKIDNWENRTVHCAQITGIIFFNKYLITTSIDQRISLFEWAAYNNIEIKCKYIEQKLTTVADIQGIEIINKSGNCILICIHGRGVDILKFELVDE